jgi:hypothetical protein
MLYAFVLIMTIIVLSAPVWGQGSANDPGQRDTLYIGSVTVDPGQKAVVEINFFSDEELAALTVPLAWTSADITIDSVSYVGSRADYLITKPYTIYNDIQKVVCGAVVVMEANIAAGNGLFVTLHFDVPPGTPDQFVYIDTTTHVPAQLLFTNINSSSFTPEVIPGNIQIGDPQVPPHIELSPALMIFEGTVGYPNPPGQALSITNSGQGALTWTASVSSGWLSANPPNGSAPSNTSINVDISGLAEGTYYDTLVITAPDADNSPQYLPVTLDVITLPPNIVYSPAEFSISAVQGGANPENRHLNIDTDIPGSELNWTVSNSTGWLSLSPTSGTPPDSVALQFDITGLAFGFYYDTVVISDPAATNNPQYVPVTLQIVSDLPVLELDPPIVHVVAVLGQGTPPKEVLIYNSGEGVMTFDTEENSKAIAGITPSSGTAPQAIQISFNMVMVPEGDSYDTIIVTSPEAINSPQLLIVHYHHTVSPARLVLIPQSIQFSYYECWQGTQAIPPIRIFQVLNTGADIMRWWLTYNSEWLMVDTESGIDGAFVRVTIDAEGFPMGTFYDTITVFSDDAINGFQKLPVTLNVIPGTDTPEIVLTHDSKNVPAQEVFGSALNLFAVTQLYNAYPGCMDWWVEEDIPWLKFIDSSGQAPATPVVAIEIGDYTWGVYPDSFYIHSSTASNSPVKMYLNLQVWRLHGDFGWNNEINVGDVVQMINYAFNFGPGPQPEYLVGDCNCDHFIGVDDIVLLINYIFKFGNKPCGNP